MRRLARGTLAFITACLFLLFVLLIHIQGVAYSLSFYQSEFVKLGRAKALETTSEQLASYSRHTTRYLMGLEDDPNLPMVIGGKARPFLNDREVRHMRDVQVLFAGARLVTGLGLAAALMWAVAGWRRGHFSRSLRSLAIVASCALLIGLVIAWFINRDFTASFNLFHHLAFTNDLWQLNPDQDLLINLLPEQFFADAVMLAAYRTGLTLVLVALIAIFGSLRLVRAKSS